MSVVESCPDCCTCPAPTVEWDSVSASKSKCAYAEFSGYVSTPPKRYRTATMAAVPVLARIDFDSAAGLASGSFTYPLSCALSTCGGVEFIKVAITGDFSGELDWAYGSIYELSYDVAVIAGADCAGGDYFVNFSIDSVNVLPISATVGAYSIGGTVTLSDEYTTAELITQAHAELPAYDGDWNDTAGSFINLSTDELSAALSESRYRLRFKIPLIGSGACYRVQWVERFVAEAGAALTSAEIIMRGVYRPTVTVTGDGTGAEVVAVMASDGAVDFFRVVNPGQDYTTITITVESAINGGTTATGTGNLVGGQLASVTKTASGDYLPTGAFSGGSGIGATITFTLDETGGLATCPLGATGSGYTSEPALTITPKVSGSLAALVHLHLGTETARCAEWDGDVPEDYDPEDSDTYPILGDGTNPYFELPVPEADGTVLVANVLAFCDCSSCP